MRFQTGYAKPDMRVTTRVYSGYRHEIHNYSDIKDEVEDGILQFMLTAVPS